MEHWRSLELKKCENKIKVLIIFKLGVVYIIMLKKNITIYVFQEFKNYGKNNLDMGAHGS